MKRNKPFVKHGANPQRRGRYHFFDERRRQEWSVAVPQSVVRDSRAFSMDGAQPAGEDGSPDNPLWKGLCRWRLDRGGKSFLVYGRWYGFPTWQKPGFFIGPLPDGEVFHTFTSHRKCTNGKSCPLVRYWCEDIDFSLSDHRPGTCPAGVPGPGTWRYTGRFTAVAR